MSNLRKTIRFTAIPAVLLGLVSGNAAQATDYSNSASYNQGYGGGAEMNQTIDPSLRDANGNLTVVNGQFTSSAFSQQTGVQSMSTSSSSSSASASAGVGSSGTGSAFGGATAIGNQLNVVTVGNNNTVIVNSTQTNNGNQTATVDVNSK
jgi:holdfast attachment protein HfaA